MCVTPTKNVQLPSHYYSDLHIRHDCNMLKVAIFAYIKATTQFTLNVPSTFHTTRISNIRKRLRNDEHNNITWVV